MDDIDRLLSNVYNLRRQRAGGNPVSDEERQLQESLTGLEEHYTKYSKQLGGASDGVPVPHEHLDFLQGYARHALQDARSVASSMELDTLPLHTDILTPSERESFAEDLAIVNSLLQSKAGPLAPEDVQTLMEAASRLGEHNSRCENTLNTLSHPEHNNDPVQFQSIYGSIDRFQRALEHAVEKAIGTEPPAPPVAEPEIVTTPETTTTQEKVDQSLVEMRKYLDLSKGRPLTEDESNIVRERYDNVMLLTKSLSFDHLKARVEAGSILEKIESHKRKTTPKIETAAREIISPTSELNSDDDDLYSPPSRLPQTSNSDGSETTIEERIRQVKKRVQELVSPTDITSNAVSPRDSVSRPMPYDAGKQEAWESRSTVSALGEDEDKDDDAISVSDISVYTDANDGTNIDDDDKRASR